MPQAGKLFSQYKALGYVSNDVPLVTRYIRRRKETLLVTAVGRAFHTYGCSHFALLSISSQHDEDICCLAGDTYHVYTAAGSKVYAWRRGCELKHTYTGHTSNVHIILPFGPLLVTVDETNNLRVWDIKTEDCIVNTDFNRKWFRITSLMHPSTYLNKIVIGSELGAMHLYNIQSQSVIYTFKGWGSGVQTMVQSPALHVAGIGLKSGDIILHNLKLDETVMRFHQEWGPVVSLSFRTDAPFMVSGSGNGRIVCWDLENRKVFSQILTAHYGAVTGLQCLSQEPLMVSSSPDNSLKLWIFDKADGSARLLRVREGHSCPPSFIRFHGANGQNMLSGGGDSCLRIFNTVTETFNKSLGRASYNRKASKKKGKMVEDALIMPPLVGFTSETTREKEWDSIAVMHLGIPHVTTWSYGKLKMGDIRLIHDRFKKKKITNGRVTASASSLALTHCGNFVVVGYTSGHVERYNIQSGLHRATYGSPAHSGSVRGVAVDNLNQAVVTGGSDEFVSWWHFSKLNRLSTLKLESAISFFCCHRESGVLAVALESYNFTLLDLGERTIIRQLPGHSARLTDAAFSPDARWLVTAGMDNRICTWDVPAGCLVDRFEVDAACTSITFSPTGELLATTHVDCLGIYLWMNRSLYTHITLRPLTAEETPLVALPMAVREETDSDQEEEEEAVYESEVEDTCSQIGDMLTLSGLPSSRWLNILNIDLIRKRNRPTVAKPSAPAPFFLPTIPSLDVRFDLSDANATSVEPSTEHLLTLTPFARALQATKTSNLYVNIISKLKNMGPSAINYEINALSSEDTTCLLQFMKMVKEMLDEGRDIELAQAYLGLFLKVHGETITKNDALRDFLTELQVAQEASWQKLESKLFYTQAVIQAIKNI